MSEPQQVEHGKGVWFVYDGDCPMCSMAAHATKIQKRCGPLHLVDARRDIDDPLLAEINRRKLNLDEGMVIRFEDRFYHGADALRFMAQFGETKGWLNRLNRSLFSSEKLALLSYPWLRATRNLLLKVKGVGKLDNLKNPESPLFQTVFGPAWDTLPLVMRRHYANRADRDEVVTVVGSLNIHLSPIARLLKPVFRCTGTLVPYEGKDVPVTVDFVTETGSAAFRFERRFEFPGRAPYYFRSAMFPLGGNEVVEMMRCGLGWRAAYSWDGAKVILAHRGYVVRLFGMLVPVPLALLMGRGYAEEHPLSDDSFSMWTETRHLLWGRVFGYDGIFTVTKDR